MVPERVDLGGSGQRAPVGAAARPPDDGPGRARGAGHRRTRRSQVGARDRACRPAVPGQPGQDRQRRGLGDEPVGRRAGLLPAGLRRPTRPSTTSPRARPTRLFAPSCRSRGIWRPRPSRRSCRSGRSWPIASTGRTPGFAAPARVAGRSTCSRSSRRTAGGIGKGPSAPSRTRPWRRGGGTPPSGGLGQGGAGLPRRAPRDLVGVGGRGRAVWPRAAPASGRRHHRSGDLARPPDLVPGHQPPYAGRPAGPAAHRPPIWRRWCGCTGCACGWSRATSRPSTRWAGASTRSAPTRRCAATGSWSAAPSPSAGTNGSPHPAPWMPPRRTRAPTRGQRGGSAPSHQHQQPCWPRALRAIRSWLAPAVTLNRWWRAWTDRDPPSELQALIDAVTTGHGIDLYRRI